MNVSLSVKDDHNLFYWFFKNTALTNPPLVLWINGGPGSTSMFGLFLENGPLRVTKTGTGLDDFQIKLSSEGSWVDIADVIFLDQPVNTGFSYGKTYIDRMETGADHFVLFLNKFFKMYPEYKGRDFYISGESYAGKYLPHFTYQISKYNRE